MSAKKKIVKPLACIVIAIQAPAGRGEVKSRTADGRVRPANRDCDYHRQLLALPGTMVGNTW
jgi:hypothetical protein